MYESREVVEQRFRKFVADFLDEIPEPLPEGVHVGTIALVAEIERTGEDGDMGTSEVWYRCSDRRPWIQVGLLRAAVRTAESENGDDGGHE